MIHQSFNHDWIFRKAGSNLWDENAGGYQSVTLPHDAMIWEERSPHTANGGNTGYYPGNLYEYRKHFFVPNDWAGQETYLEFDGVYCNARVYLNGALAAQRPYGYSQFSFCMSDYLRYGQDNEIQVMADTSPEKQSRWYTGAGIYRDVKLYLADAVHIPLHSLKISSCSADSELALLRVAFQVRNHTNRLRSVRAVLDIFDSTDTHCFSESFPLSISSGEDLSHQFTAELSRPALWSPDSPSLYRARLTIREDERVLDLAEERFGIRTLQLDAQHGLRLNGQAIKLRGACIHHDLGILGAADFEQAEERRIRQLKEAGFNCIRSAHNPAGPRLLEVCDRMGMLVMDEAFDMWTHTKCDNDYANVFPQWWKEDLQSMVEKDYNHPCVILYSIGNEIDEAGTPAGARLNRKLAGYVRSLDQSRFLTNSVNGMIVLMDQLEQIIPEILVQLEDADKSGSNDLNNIVSLCAGKSGDLLFGHPLIAERTEETYASLDVAGMNYMTVRYEADHERFPHRVMLSTESFPGDLVRIWKKVKALPYVIGDMTWTGYDYLGEAGGGLFRYDGSPVFDPHWPMRTAYMGDLNLIGTRRPVSYLREIVFGLRKEPYIAVDRPEHYGQTFTINPWALHDDLASWSWPGFEGKPTVVRVYSSAEEVELFLNEESIGRKPAGLEACYEADFELPYQPGILRAVAYSGGVVTGNWELKTLSDDRRIRLELDKSELRAGGEDICFLKIRAEDKNGTLDCQAAQRVRINVQGAGFLQAFGSADPVCDGNYFDAEWKFFEGELLAVIRSEREAGTISVHVSAEELGEESLTIQVY